MERRGDLGARHVNGSLLRSFNVTVTDWVAASYCTEATLAWIHSNRSADVAGSGVPSPSIAFTCPTTNSSSSYPGNDGDGQGSQHGGET